MARCVGRGWSLEAWLLRRLVSPGRRGWWYSRHCWCDSFACTPKKYRVDDKLCTKCVYITVIQWSLRIKDTLGAELLSFIGRLSSGGRFESLLSFIQRLYVLWWEDPL